MERIDQEHYKICLINNNELSSKIDNLIQETFNNYVRKKNINYTDEEIKEEDFRDIYELSLDCLFKELNCL
tara:strand:+ start:15464 stop:15676 length:213 start_codon:yes stop_codon:yes gene_type:complete